MILFHDAARIVFPSCQVHSCRICEFSRFDELLRLKINFFKSIESFLLVKERNLERGRERRRKVVALIGSACMKIYRLLFLLHKLSCFGDKLCLLPLHLA
jgi:hypothetical protein